jgi:preprotein translocase subunit SecY
VTSISASIVVRCWPSAHPALAALKKEGESGRRSLNQYTRYGAVFLTAVQGWFLASGLEAYARRAGCRQVNPGYLFRVGAVVSLIGGTMFLLWLGEQITSARDHNGVSLIIMAGIVRRCPSSSRTCSKAGAPISPFVIAGVTVMILRARGDDLLHGARARAPADPVSQARDAARHDECRSQPPAA